MEMLTFDKLPEAVALLLTKVENIELMLAERGIEPAKDELFDVAEAAAFLKMAIATVYSKVCRRELPVNKKGRRIYFYKAELDEWVRNGRRRTVAEIKDNVQFTNKNNRNK